MGSRLQSESDNFGDDSVLLRVVNQFRAQGDREMCVVEILVLNMNAWGTPEEAFGCNISASSRR